MENLISSAKCAFFVDENSPLNPEKHFLRKTLNKSVHPIAKEFLQLGNSKIIEIFSELNPTVNKKILEDYLNYESKYFQWGGSDLFHVKTKTGETKMIVVEMNSGPGGRGTLPGKGLEAYKSQFIIVQNFFDAVSANCEPTSGGLAVIYDAYYTSVLGCASVLAKISKEKVWVVEYPNDDPNPPVKWVNGFMHIRDNNSSWHPIRACFNNMNINPWNRIPINSKTLIINNILACLCGGRNKTMADHAYAIFNQEQQLIGSGLKIDTPDTKRNVKMEEIPAIIKSMGGRAVVKLPYSTGGTEVDTILTQADLIAFMERNTNNISNENYLVQYLVTPYSWNQSVKGDGQGDYSNEYEEYFHVGTLKEEGKSFVHDLRIIISSGKGGFSPATLFCRRARKNIESVNDPNSSTWDILGTNVAQPNYLWDEERVMICDETEFPMCNLNLIDLINGYIQSVLALIAIDKLCQKCINQKGLFDSQLFQYLNGDEKLLSEILK